MENERKIYWKDNGYALLKYIKKNRPDINAYYVIDKKSKSLDKVKEISNAIFDKSIKHWIYYFNVYYKK